MKKFSLILLLLISFSVSAFTTEQKTALKAAALLEGSISTCITAGDDQCVADWYNNASTFIVWKPKLTIEEIYSSTGFDFSLVDGLTVGKRDEWKDFLFRSGYVDPSKLNIRTGIIDVWSGTTAKNAVQAAILALAKKFATNAEKVLATGTGTDTIPGILTWTGTITTLDVSEILR